MIDSDSGTSKSEADPAREQRVALLRVRLN
jgi:hypothetical protein